GAVDVGVVRAPRQTEVGSIPHLRVTMAGAGPLAGLEAALAAGGAALVAVLAVDMPAIEAAWFRWLLGYCSVDSGAVAYHGTKYEPLCTFYPRAALWIVSRHVRSADRALHPLVRSLAAERLVTM